MQYALTNTQMREADSYTINTIGIPSCVLMQRAGVAVAEEVASAVQTYNFKNILVVCGTGNNGGDGYVCARELLNRGFCVKVYAAEGRLSADCEREKQKYNGGFVDCISGDIIVDCLFGTGLSRKAEGSFAAIIESINSSGAYVISADIPSGINGDNGLVCGVAVRADVTVAIAEYKVGHFLNDGTDYCGKVIKKDIGIVYPASDYAAIPEDCDIKPLFPKRRRNVHKGTFGTAQLVAGSPKYIGAAALAAEAALKSGCGYVKLCTAESVKNSVAPRLPQTIFGADMDFSAAAVAIGPGCGVSKELYNTISKLIKEYKGGLIIDADGLNALSAYGTDILKNSACRIALTPHVKEFSRLSGLPVEEILRNPVHYACGFAKEYGVTLLLKSSVSVLTDGTKTMLLTRGNSALSKGGSGDMLTGFACGTAARGVELFNAVAAASYIIGKTAEICSAERTEYCVTSKDLLKNIHKAVKGLTD